MEPKTLNCDVFTELRARELPYNMYGMLQLDMFNPCTWDIFHTHEGKRRLVHLRVRGATFRMREGFFQVKGFDSCDLRKNGIWGPSEYTRPEQLRRYLFNEIVASQRILKLDADEKNGHTQCVVFPKIAQFDTDWVAGVFYPHGIDPDSQDQQQVIGWTDKLNPRWNISGSNEALAVQTKNGVVIKLTKVPVEEFAGS